MSIATARHEAGHARTAALLGLAVRNVRVEPDDRTGGRVDVVYRNTRDDLRQRLLAILGGLLESDAISAWPLRTDRTTDERRLAEIAQRPDLDAADYERAVNQTANLPSHPHTARYAPPSLICASTPRASTMHCSTDS